MTRDHATPKQQKKINRSTHMKTHRWLTRNRFVSHLRMAGAVILISAAAAMAFVAVKPSGPLWVKSDDKDAINKFRQNRAASFRNKLAIPGPEREGGPRLAAEEEYAKRAYPAPYVPFELTRQAQRAWSNVMAIARGRAPSSVGPWTLVGPSSANDPNVLTFSGAPYTTSGQVTALAIAPNCGQGHCYLYLAAAGGGIWKTAEDGQQFGATRNRPMLNVKGGQGRLCRGAKEANQP